MSTQKREKGPDEVIQELGGCGRFQVRVAVIIHLMNIVATWSMYAMVFVSASTKWRCRDDDSFLLDELNVSQDINKTFGQVCHNRNGSSCSEFEFATTDMHTIVTEVRIFLLFRICLQVKYMCLTCHSYICQT